MSSATYYSPGAWNAICDGCGGKFKNFNLTKDWKGLMKCKKCWEPRQPQDFVRAVPDHMAAPWARPVPAPIFVLFPYETAIVDIAIVDIAIVDAPYI